LYETNPAANVEESLLANTGLLLGMIAALFVPDPILIRARSHR